MHQNNQALLPLVHQWRDHAETLRRYGAETSAATLETCAAGLETTIQEGLLEPLTLGEASQLSGYTTDHLGRLIRDGKVPNAGRPGAPRILRRDLPVKAGAVASATPKPDLDRTQIVRSAINAGV